MNGNYPNNRNQNINKYNVEQSNNTFNSHEKYNDKSEFYNAHKLKSIDK